VSYYQARTVPHVQQPYVSPQVYTQQWAAYQAHQQMLQPGPVQAYPQQQHTGWPDSCKEYVRRNLSACVDTDDKDRVQKKLKELMESKVAKNELWSTDWATLPLISFPESKRSRGWEKAPGFSDLHIGVAPASVVAERPKKCSKLNVTDNSFVPNISKTIPNNSWPKYLPAPLDNEEARRKAERRRRFSPTSSGTPVKQYRPDEAAIQGRQVASAMRKAQAAGVELDLSTFAVKGKCKDLEKKYLRLTCVPDPSTVRPRNVLKRSLKMVRTRWSTSRFNKNRRSLDVEDSGVTYLWVCEQLKSIRQDLTIQHIKDHFTAKVYESHARIALREADLKEFNQCITQLQDLYNEVGSTVNKEEFAGYNVLYLVYTHVKYGQSKGELSNLLVTMPKDILSSTNVKHAIALRSAVEERAYSTFFGLCKNVPAEGKHLTDMLTDYMRFQATQVVFKSFRPEVSLVHLKQVLFIGVDEEETWREHFTSIPKLVMGSNPDCYDAKLSWDAFSGKFQWPVLDGDQVQHSKT